MVTKPMPSMMLARLIQSIASLIEPKADLF